MNTPQQHNHVENIQTVSGYSPLTDWKKEPSASDLMGDYTNASSSHSHQRTKIENWLNLLHSKTDKTKIRKGRSGVTPRVIRRLAEWRYSALSIPFLNEQNLFHVTATSSKHLDAAFQNELILNNQFNNQINKVKFINNFIRTAVNEGTVIVRVGWDNQVQTKESEIPVYSYIQANDEEKLMLEGLMNQILQEQEMMQLDTADETDTFKSVSPSVQESIRKSVEHGMPILAVDTGAMQTIKEEVVVKNQPEVQVIDNRSLIIDPTCGDDFSKARFAVYVFTTSLSELKQDGRYNLKRLLSPFGSNSVITTNGEESSAIMNLPDDVFSDLNLNETDTAQSFTFQDNPRKRITAYEYWGYWDIDGTGIVQGIVATIVNNTIIRLERNPFPDGKLPFVVVPYMPVKNSVYGEPDAELVKDNQQVIQALTRAMMDIQARSANGQTAIPKGYLDPTNLVKFRNGEDYEYNIGGAHPSEAVYMHTANEVPQSTMVLVQQHYAEAEAATGIKAFQNGIDGNAYGQVVAGMSQAITAMTQRESDIIIRLSQGLQEIGNKIISMNTEWLSEQETIRNLDDEYIVINREDLYGNFYLNVDIKSNSESEGKAQQLTFLMQTLGNDTPWDVRRMFLLEIARLYNLTNMAQMVRKYEPQPDPVQQQLQQLQIQELQAKINKLEEEAMYYRKRSEFIDAQVPNIQADTDQKNLDFLEQESGAKHAREVERIQAQAREQNKGKLAQETIKSASAEKVAAINARKAMNEGTANTDNRKSSGTGIPNPERASVPKGLYKADGLGNYVFGDNTR